MNKKELRKLSKGELIKIILDFAERIEALENRLKIFDNPNTPSAKKRNKQNTEHDDENRFPGKPKGSDGSGIDMPPPDREVKITKDFCPICGERLGKPYDTYHFRQMDIPAPNFITTLYEAHIYKCNGCKEFIDAAEHLEKGFYGENTSAMAGYLKKEGLSNEAISEFFNCTYGLPISSVTVFNKIASLTDALAPEKDAIAKAINISEYNHLDETGLREDGKNGYVWNVSTPLNCLFQYNRSRASDVPKGILSDFNGAIVTDDYKGYAWHPKRQLCWSHLLREAKEFNDYDGAEAQYIRLKSLYDRAKRAQEMSDPDQFDNLAWELQDIANCYHVLDGCRIMYSKINERTELWLLGVKHPNIPLTNNHAERCLRKVVLQRNRIGCIRNEKGENFINTFLSCVTTWKLQGKNVYKELLRFAS